MATAIKPKGKYTAKNIEVLEGLEAVRRRPSMYIGGTDARGLHHLVWEVIDNSVDEYLADEADRCIVTLHKDGCSISVQDNGRGIPVDKHAKTKKSALEVILTRLHAGGKFSDKNYVRSGGLHGVGSSVVNALSTEMVATIHRDGWEWVQRYRRGKPTTPVKKVKKFRGHGTTIYFRPDDTIFKRIHFNPAEIRQHLEDISYIHGGLSLTFVDEAKNERHEFSHPEGIAAFIEKLIADGEKRTLHDQTFAVEEDDGKSRIEAVLKWTDGTDEQIRSYVNGIRTRAGGTHENGFRAGFAKAVQNYMEVHKIKPKGVQISREDIREGVVGILSFFHPDPMFQGQTKERLNNPEVAAQVESIILPALESWLNTNPTIAEEVIARIVLAARARAASRSAAAEVRRKTPGSRKSNLPGKLLDCRSNKPGESELFIVEGESAGGTAAMGRNSKTQAVLPLRGKVLNTESLSTARILNNQVINDLVETLGTSIGANFDVSRLRYHRVILLMDADSDGHHISTLLLTFFFRHMPDLIRDGYLYLAQPPLYKIEVGKKTYYAHDDIHREEILATLPANRNPMVTRFKGLGEMNEKQLRETTLDPKLRTLLRVQIDAPLETDQTFQQLLGKDPSQRYDIIMEEAGLVEELDI